MKKPVIVAGFVILAGVAAGIWGFLHDPSEVAAAVSSADGYRKVSSAGIDFEWKVDGANLHSFCTNPPHYLISFNFM